MSFIDLESREIQTLDIMADSAGAKQMLFALKNKLDWPNGLIFASI